jgi:hypothetical protein
MLYQLSYDHQELKPYLAWLVRVLCYCYATPKEPTALAQPAGLGTRDGKPTEYLETASRSVVAVEPFAFGVLRT